MKCRCERNSLVWTGVLALAWQAACAVALAQTPAVDGPLGGPNLLPLAAPPTYSDHVVPSLLDDTDYLNGHADSHVAFGPTGFAGACCGDCPPGWQARVDGLLLDQDIVEFTSSNAIAFNDLGYEQGARVSLIRRLDCLDAFEVTYIGPYEWEEFGQIDGVGLTSRLSSIGLDLSEFDNATRHEQSLRSTLNSLEVNRRWFGWDVISTFAGFRYMHIGEDYLFRSTGAMGLGELAIETNNHLIGGQVGMELMYPLGKWMSTATAKGGLFGNVIDGNGALTNNGVTHFANSANDLGFAAAIEVGYLVSYQVTPRIRVRGGYEVWWLYGVALATNQITSPLTTSTSNAVDDDTILYHGATAGVEVVW